MMTIKTHLTIYAVATILALLHIAITKMFDLYQEGIQCENQKNQNLNQMEH